MQTNFGTGDEWSAYWRDGRTAACRQDDRGLYRGVIARCWNWCFQKLSDDARVLDLATGNGAVLEVAVQQAAETHRHFSLMGVDQAQIAPRLLEPGAVPNCDVAFLPNTHNEALPLAANMFDLVTSQYGVEYGNLTRTVQEVRRVLKPKGRLCWVCHWHEGSVAKGSAREIEDIQFIEALGLPRLMAELVKIQLDNGKFIADSHQRTALSPERQALQAALNQAFERLRVRQHKNESNLAVYLRNLAHIYQFREQHAPELVLGKLKECGNELLLHKKRLQALVDASLTRPRLSELIATLHDIGFSVADHGPLQETGQMSAIGYYLDAELQ